jgi:hypothetical protein
MQEIYISITPTPPPPSPCLLSFQSVSSSKAIFLTYNLGNDPLEVNLGGLFPSTSLLCKPDLKIQAEPLGSFDYSALVRLVMPPDYPDPHLVVSANRLYSEELMIRVTATYMKNDLSITQTKY